MRNPHTATNSSPRSPQLEKARAQQQRHNAAKNKKTKKTKLDYNRSKISRTEWNAYFNWYFEASQLLSRVWNCLCKRLTEASKWLKKDKMAPEAWGSSSLASLSQALPLAPSSSFFSMMPTPPLYLQIPHSNSSTKLSLFSETLPTPFSSALVRTCLFKMKSSEDPEAKPLISYTTWAKAEMQAIVKDLPEETEDLNDLLRNLI